MGATERWTNIRFADNLLLYAKSCHEFATMITFLKEGLSKIGLRSNADKTRLFTTSSLKSPLCIDVDDDVSEVLFADKNTYIPRAVLPRNARKGQHEFVYRAQVARGRFMKHGPLLQNMHISVCNRFFIFFCVCQSGSDSDTLTP